MDRKRRNRRGWVMVLVCVVCFPASVAALFGVLVLSLPKWRAAVIALFAGGLVLSVVGGWLLGKLLWYAGRKGGVILGVLVLDALATVFMVFAVLSMVQGHPVCRHILCEPVIFAATIQLLVANSYAVGFAFFPGPVSVSGGRRLMVLLFLYGAIAVGVAIQRTFPLPWEKVPPYPGEWNSVMKRPRRVTFAEFLQDQRTGFPKRDRIEETPEGIIRIQYQRPQVSWLRTEVHDDVFMAEGSRAVLPEGTVEILGLDMYCREPDFWHPDGTPRHIEPSEEELEEKRKRGMKNDDRLPCFERVGLWRIDGTPMSGEEWPRQEVSWSRGGFLSGGFLIETKGDIHRFGGSPHQLVLTPWETKIGEHNGASGLTWDEENEAWREVVEFRLGPPIPGPLELRLACLRADEREYVLPAKQRHLVHLERNSLQLLEIAQGRFQRKLRQGEWDLVLIPVEDSEHTPRATAVFATLVQTYEWKPLRLKIRAVRRDDSMLEAADIKYAYHLVCAEFDCEPRDIDRFIFVERAHVTQIRFPVTDIPFFPRENYRLDNLLELRFPCRVHQMGDIYSSLPPGRLKSGMPGFLVSTPMKDPLNASLREILDHHYPGAWWAEDGKLRFGSRRSLRSRLREAFRSELSGSAAAGAWTRYWEFWVGPVRSANGCYVRAATEAGPVRQDPDK